MKTIHAVLHLGILISIAGCDPGVTIRQGDPQNESRVSRDVDDSSVLVHVKSIRQLTGETLYAPEIQVRNSLESPITITSVELAAKSGTYANTFPRPETYP